MTWLRADVGGLACGANNLIRDSAREIPRQTKKRGRALEKHCGQKPVDSTPVSQSLIDRMRGFFTDLGTRFDEVSRSPRSSHWSAVRRGFHRTSASTASGQFAGSPIRNRKASILRRPRPEKRGAVDFLSESQKFVDVIRAVS